VYIGWAEPELQHDTAPEDRDDVLLTIVSDGHSVNRLKHCHGDARNVQRALHSSVGIARPNSECQSLQNAISPLGNIYVQFVLDDLLRPYI